MTKKELLEKLEDIENWLNNYTLWVEEAYCDIRNNATDYDYNLEELFYDYLTSEEVDEMVVHEAQTWGIARVYYFLWDVNPMCCDLFKLDWYANLEEVHKDDLIDLIDEIRDNVWDYEEEEEEDEEE